MNQSKIRHAGALLSILLSLSAAWAGDGRQDQAPPKEAKTDGAALSAVKAQLDALKADYEKRIKDLEAQVEQLQARMLQVVPEEEAAVAAPAQPPSQQQVIPGVLNPAIAVVGNFLYRGDGTKVYGEDGNRIDNKLSFREAEIDMRVAVDPYADAVLIGAFGAETPGRYSADIEEGYVNIKRLPFMSRPPLGLKLKVGRFRPSFGKVNILHTHDLPQSFRPLPIQEFMGEEGFIQSGISGNLFVPTPWSENSTLDATLQVLTGGDVAISPDPQSRVSYLGHLRWFGTVKDSHSLELGWSSYYHPEGKHAREADFHGFDFTYRWKPLRQGEWKSFLLGSEFMFARRAYPEAAEPLDVARALEGLPPGQGKPVGFTLFSQWQFDRHKYAGVRWDQTDVLYNPGLRRRSLTPYFSYYFSEFLRFRLNYEHRWSDLFTEDKRNSVYAELNFVFGSHPPEPFWVNK